KGTIESGTNIHYPNQSNLPLISYFVTPHDGIIHNLYVGYVFADNSPIKTFDQDDSIVVELIIANKCNFDAFHQTCLSSKLKYGKFCSVNLSKNVHVKCGDRIALQIIWISKSQQTNIMYPLVLFRCSYLFE